MKRNLLLVLAILLVMSMAVISAGHPATLVVEPTHVKITPDPTSPPTKVPEDTPTPQIKESETPEPSETPESSSTPSVTHTQQATSTQTPVNTETPSATPTAQELTSTPTDTPVRTSTATKTETPTPTGTLVQSPTPTDTPTREFTQTPTPTGTGIQTATATNTPVPTTETPTSTATPETTESPVPTVTQSDITQVVTEITTTVKINREGDGQSVNSYIVGLIKFPTLRRWIPIGLGWVKDGSFEHSINVAGRISENDFGVHQKFVPELAGLRAGSTVRIDGATFRVKYVVTVKDKNQAQMERLLARWTTITTCTADWKDNLVFLLKEVDERGLRE